MLAIDPKYRVVSGGQMKDFDTTEQAANYLIERIKFFGYAAMVKVYTFKNDN